jgi:hypothetical protein
MIKAHLRHYVIIDLQVFRDWATDRRIAQADLINNQDGTYGRGFDINWMPPEMFIVKSATIDVMLERGMDAIEPLATIAPRQLRRAPSLQDLVAKHAGYDRISPEAWAKYDAEMAAWRRAIRTAGEAEIPHQRSDGHAA